MTEKGTGKLGIIGDVHAEDIRLESSLSFLVDQGCDKIVCTGDIIDGPGCPNRSVELLKAFEVITVRGNHDRWIIENKARHVKHAHKIQDLSGSTLDYLNLLPSEAKFLFAYGAILCAPPFCWSQMRMLKVWNIVQYFMIVQYYTSAQ